MFIFAVMTWAINSIQEVLEQHWSLIIVDYIGVFKFKNKPKSSLTALLICNVEQATLLLLLLDGAFLQPASV